MPAFLLDQKVIKYKMRKKLTSPFIEFANFEALIKLKEDALKGDKIMQLYPSTTGTRWSQNDRLRIRLFLLINKGKNENDVINWKDATGLVKDRTSVQIRTHIQKRRELHRKHLKSLSSMLDFAKKVIGKPYLKFFKHFMTVKSLE